MSNNARYSKIEIIKKYKRSIVVDQIIAFIPFAFSIFIKNTLDQIGEGFGSLFIIIIFLITSSIYLTSDYFMNNSSIGKKIYGIEVLANNNNTRKLLFLSVISRRLLELTYHPLIKKDFSLLSNKIDTYTSTIIIIKYKEKI